MFNLELMGPPEGEGERLYNWGRITLGHFQEDFQAPLYDWAPGDYEAQWVEAAERLVDGSPVVVFLTHMVHPTAPYHIGWPAWREGDVVHVQHSIEGQPISQWRVTVADVAQFLDRRRHAPPPEPPAPTARPAGERPGRGRRARR